MARELIGKMLIYTKDGSHIEGACAGPNWFGGCPKAPAGEVVACAGQTVVVTSADGREIVLEIEADATACPLVALGMPDERQPAAS